MCIVVSFVLISCLAYKIKTNSGVVTREVTSFRSSKFLQPVSHTSSSSLFMSDEENTNIVPVDKANIENAAAVTGGFLGFVLAGPLAGVVLAALTNYVVKKDNDSGEALRGIGKTVVESYNYLTKINSKYGIANKASKAIGKAIDEAAIENESVQTLKETLDTSTKKVSELNKEFDLVGKAKQFTSAAADLSDKAIDAVDEANTKYDFVKVAKETAYKAIDAVREQSNKASE